jgi:hypothetical protein
MPYTKYWWPYGAYHLCCCVVGWYLQGVIGLALGLILGPVGNLISVAIGSR